MQSELKELLAAIDSRWEGESERKRANAISPRMEEAIAAARKALSQSPEAEAQDAKRFDWLEEANPIVFHRSSIGDVWELVVGACGTEEGRDYPGATLREAVDAAMKGEASAFQPQGGAQVMDWPICEECGTKSATHSVGKSWLCCECYVKAGHPPADWHDGCMAAKRSNAALESKEPK